ncbi:hypothetical protein GNIT_0416 [Glaciecola nitratireducens FR1064]|uniref:Uncharacterized protein n=1 Tax=Glaciecola nitratireducens (strain JCM 12485 / KCTC 12276 / FR1064) TaxID=1085623 RepID=G4QJG4_GLANF|nr:hypothetical protein GNIT_0416 [Glaciecola nitratireducens FR1064]
MDDTKSPDKSGLFAKNNYWRVLIVIFTPTCASLLRP